MSMGPYNPELTPLGRRGDVLLLDDGTTTRRVEIEKYAVYPQIDLDTVTVADGSQEEVEATTLEIWDGWLFQVRMSQPGQDIPDGVTIEADLGGRQAPMYQSKEQRGVIDNTTAAISGATAGGVDTEQATHLLEFYIHEQEVPYFTYINDSGTSQDISLSFAGYGFKLRPPQDADEAEDEQDDETYVPVESIRSI